MTFYLVFLQSLNRIDFMLIPLTKGKVTSVNYSDFELINRHKWYASESSAGVYAVTNIGKRPNRKKVYMHRLILGITNGQQGHHIDGDTLNNRRYNLEVCSQQTNLSYRKYGGD